ncbi:SMI1/KNR4 family protein [Paenibacillus oryzisoli]|uniref:SMI1/KNR4 family protein n=1 Tax=Paenibacillus oryzisoli TaxID=1850517 RepID=UPI003D2A19B6
MEIKKSRVPISNKDIEEVQRKIKFTLPEDYTCFLLHNNGGIPVRSEFAFTSRFGEESTSIVQFFLAINGDIRYDDLMTDFEYFKSTKRIKPKYLPIARDPFGNLICISLDGEDRGFVYFNDHEIQLFSDNMSLISKSFIEFLGMLK